MRNVGHLFISFHAGAWKNYLYWIIRPAKACIFKKINALIRDAQRHGVQKFFLDKITYLGRFLLPPQR